jgi:hypothetical protein
LLVIAVAFGLAIPVVALAALLVRHVRRHLTREPARPASLSRIDERLIMLPNAPAWIEIDGRPDTVIPLDRELVRIGSGGDCDVRLEMPGTATGEAVLRRTVECEYVLIDLTGASEPALAVNGRRIKAAMLESGDRVRLGDATFTFHRGLASGAFAQSGHPTIVH